MAAAASTHDDTDEPAPRPGLPDGQAREAASLSNGHGTFEGTLAPDPTTPDGGRPGEPAITVRSALVVEDNVTIAFDLEATLRRLGIEYVAVAATLEEARGEVARRSFDVYLLDINLGDTTSIPLAEELVAAGKPVVFTTGYGDTTMLPEAMRDVPILDKPYLEAMLARRLRAIA